MRDLLEIIRMTTLKPNYTQTDKMGRFIPNLHRQLEKALRNDTRRLRDGRWFSGRATNA